MGNFTQGPWTYDKEDGEVYKQGAYTSVAVVLGGDAGSENGILIASAPDLYNALWEVVELSDRTLPPAGRTADCQRVYDLCLAALKKAEGE